MKAPRLYVDLDGNPIDLSSLDTDERRLLARIRRRVRTHPDWCDFELFWMRAVGGFYADRGLPRRKARETAIYRIAQDLGAQLGIAAGYVRPDDYRSDLENLILAKFGTHRAFCKATGIATADLDAVLGGTKAVSIETLAQALKGIGYTFRIVPLPATPSQRKRTG